MKTNLKKVFFKLNTPYEWGSGMDPKFSEPFNKLSLEILNKIGFKIANDGSSSFSCPEGVEGKQNLYMHPMDFSGIIYEENIEEVSNVIIEALKGNDLFTIRQIEVCELSDYHKTYIKSNLDKYNKLVGE